MLFEKPEKLRWPRSHKFVLSERGRTAEVAYRERIENSRKDSGRGRHPSPSDRLSASNADDF